MNYFACLSLIFATLLTISAMGQGRTDVEEHPVREALAGHSLSWEVDFPYETVQLRVKGPDGIVFEAEMSKGFRLQYDLIDQFGRALADGRYAYELRFVPPLDREIRDTIAAQRAVDDPLVRAAVRQILDSDRLVHSGFFSILNGTPVVSGEPRSLPGFSDHSDPLALDDSGGGFSFNVIADEDSTLKGDLCIGDGCPGTGDPLPAFGTSTLLMMDRDVRIKFDDTSVEEGFAARDWQIGANDAGSGGIEKFFIQDCGFADQGLCPGSLFPFTILGDSRNNALFVDSDGHVGLGTSTPVTLLHGVSGDSPTVRLEQDGSMALDPQSWDIGGNENGFFVRDVTGGGLTPFQVQPGAPSSSLTVSPAGNVGLGIATAARQLHLRGTNATFRMDRDEDAAAFILVRTNAAGAPLKTFVVGTIASGPNVGHFVINDLGQEVAGPGARRMTINNVGETHFTGTVQAPAFVETSSLRYKSEIETVRDSIGLLERLRGVRFVWKDSGKPSLGLIAEEVAEIIPELVKKDAAGLEAEALNYSALTAVLVEAVKDQQQQILAEQEQRSAQQIEIESQQAEIQSLRARLDRLEEMKGEFLQVKSLLNLLSERVGLAADEVETVSAGLGDRASEER